MNLKDYIFKKNCISEESCFKVIEYIKRQPWKKHTWSTYYRQGDDSVKIEFLSYDQKELNTLDADDFCSSVLKDNVISTLQNYITIMKNKVTINQFSQIRFNHYPSGTMMRKHYDHISTLFDGTLKGVPLLSVVGALNDDYSGGEFVFFDDYKIELNRGDIMVFPSSFMFEHEVKEITNGDRFSFVTWAF